MTLSDKMKREYSGKFPDGTPQKWTVSQKPAGWTLSFPNGAEMELPAFPSRDFWALEFKKDAASSTLWLRSLYYLRFMESGGEYRWPDISRAVSSFVDWSEGFFGRPRDLFSGSLDHQIALRLRTACTLRSELFEAPYVDREEVDLSLVRLVAADVFLLKELELFEDNNHGIMLSIAVLHASVLFPDQFEESFVKLWFDRMAESLSEIIDRDGFAPENTVSYQIFYVNLLSQILDFCSWAGLLYESGRRLERLRESAMVATERLLLPDSSVPPIGDSSGGPQWRFKHTSGNVFSPTNGFFVQSNETTYLSMKAGFRSVIHKQMDDGSIILWHRGVFIVRDAGLLSYDSNDPIATEIRGQRGHSSTVLKRFDRFNASKMISYSENRSRMTGVLTNTTVMPGGVDVSASVYYDGRAAVRRRVTSEDMANFEIDDEFLSNDEAFVTRFILDPSVSQFSVNGSCLEFDVEGTRVGFSAVRVDGDGRSVPARIDVRETSIATSAYVRAKVYCLLIESIPRNAGEHLITRINLVAGKSEP